MKKTAFCSLLLCITLLLPGCWSRVEIEDRAIVAAVGFDTAKNGKMEVTAQIIKPGQIKSGGEQGGGSEAVAVFTATGFSWFDAVRNLARNTGRKLYFPEMAVIVISEDLARRDIGFIIDFLMRDPEPSLRSWVLVTGGRAREVLETPIPTEKVWGSGLGEMVEVSRVHSKAPAVDTLNFLKALKNTTTCPVAAGVAVKGKEKEPEQEAVAPGKKLVLGGAAAFKDYKMAGWLDETQTRGMLWVQGKVEGGITMTPLPHNRNKLLAIEIIRADSEIKPQIDDGRITVNVKINVEGNIAEVEPGDVDINNPKTIKEIETAQNEVIEKEVWAAVTRAQELNTDIFGFGQAVRREYPRDWPEYERMWDELFPALDVRVEVIAKVKHTGMTSNPITPSAR